MATEELVNQIKGIQRSDPTGKVAWWKYADENGGAVRDPAKHEAAFLEEFVSQYNSGAFAGVQMDPGNLGELFKEGQKSSPAFKSAWATYVRQKGLKMNDPTKNGKDVLVGFLEFLGQQSMMAMSMMDAWGMGGMSQGGGWGGNGGWGGEPMAKKFKANVSTGNPAKDALVTKIKNFQRSGEEQKQAWWMFCDAQEGKNRDPARYEIDVLQMFVSGYQL